MTDNLPKPRSQTALLIDFCYLTLNYDFPEQIQVALERDYVLRTYLYDAKNLEALYQYFCAFPDLVPSQILSVAQKLWAGYSVDDIEVPSDIFVIAT